MYKRHIITVVALLFFSLPIVARVVGVKAHPFENRRLADRPSLSQGWNAFGQTTRFFTDRMPLREEAIKANRQISQSVFKTTPLQTSGSGNQGEYALQGRDGWLYLGSEVDGACSRADPQQLQAAASALSALKQGLDHVGVRSVVAVAPDKSTIYPEHLPSTYTTSDCLSGAHDRFWRSLEAPGSPVSLPLRRTLLDAKQQEKQDLYFRKDAHWNEIGASHMVRAILGQLGGPAQMSRADLKYGRREYQADLTRIALRPERDTSATLTIHRSLVAPKVPGHTFMLADSFSLYFLGLFEPYFDDLQAVWWWWSDPKQIAEAMAKADTVIVQTVERYYLDRTPKVQAIANYLNGMPAKRATPTTTPAPG